MNQHQSATKGSPSAGADRLAKSRWRKFIAASSFLTGFVLAKDCSLSPGRVFSSRSVTWIRATGRPIWPAGAKFGYTLLSVVMISNFMAILLQHLVHQARRRHRTRSRPGLSRSLLDADRLVSLDSLRNRHRRVRSGGSGRLGHRLATSLRHSAGLGLRHHRARCAGRALPSEQRFSLHRSAGHHADRDHRQLASRPN